MENKKIIEWLGVASNTIINPGDSQDVHIDELGDFQLNDKERLFDEVLELAVFIKTNLLSKIKDGHRLFIYVALDSDSNTILGVPRTYTSLLDRIDISYPPELVLYKEFEDTDFNKVELYKSCLPFQIKYDDLIDVVYRELRNYEELVNNEEFTKELNIYIC